MATIPNETLKNSYDSGDAGTDIYAQAFIQQTLFGASIMDFNVALGLNSASSTLSLRLVEDDLNYGTEIRKNYLRDAVTEGYHPWNRNAFPKRLLEAPALSFNNPEYPKYGVKPAVDELPDGNTASVTLDPSNAKGDIFFAPEAGSPVFFRYYMPDNLNERCVREETESSKKVIDLETHGVCQESEQNSDVKTKEFIDETGNSPETADDCEDAGGIWLDGSCRKTLTKSECGQEEGFWVESASGAAACIPAFEFNGIFKKYEKTYGSSGVVYNVEITDPRVLLENTTVILKDIANRTAPADAWVVPDSHRRLENGWRGQRNVLNVFGYYENVNMGNSNVNDAGMVWWDPLETTAPDGKSLLTAYLGEFGWGILGALDLMLSHHEWHTDTGAEGSGHNDDGIVSDYVLNGEPFGGPLYYGNDSRKNIDAAPLGERYIKNPFVENDVIKIHRYKVNLTGLQQLSEVFNPADCIDPETGDDIDPLDWLDSAEDVDGAARAFRDNEENCLRSGGKFIANGTLPRDFRINADKISLLSLIEQVCSAAGADFFVSLERPDRNELKEENYAGVIKVVPIFRSKSLVTPVQHGIRKKIKEHNWLSVGLDLALDDKEPTGPFTRPITNDPLVNPDFALRQSIISSASLGYEFGDPVTGAILYGGRRSRIVGVTPLGDRKRSKHEYQSPFSAKDDFDRISPSPFQFPVEDVSYEYLPSIELDGVALRHQTTLSDPFYEMENQESIELQAIEPHGDRHDGFTWNDYGDEYIPAPFSPTGFELDPKEFLKRDYFRNGPHYSNDDFLPFYYWKDFKDPDNEDKTFDPYQLNRVNSKGFKDKAKKVGSCTNPAYTSQADCELHGGCDGAASPPRTKAECDELECLKIDGNTWNNGVCRDSDGDPYAQLDSWLQYTWNPDPVSARSGYLDIYPCWGFEQKTVAEGKYSNTFDDVIDIKEEKEPIKGMFWDDDPYRDFHPSEGIFSVFEFYNPGLGECIKVGCNKPYRGIPKCVNTTTGEAVLGADGNPAGEDECLVEGQCISGGVVPPEVAEGEVIEDFFSRELCEAHKDVDGNPTNTWDSVNTWLKDGDDIDDIFDGEAAAKVCQESGAETNQPIEALKNMQIICECRPLAPFRNEETGFIAKDLKISVKDDCAVKREAANLDTGIVADPENPPNDDTGELGGFMADLTVEEDKTEWRPHCTERRTCKSSNGVVISQLHTEALGTPNNVHKTRGGCENGCFKITSAEGADEGDVTHDTDPVVAYYLKDAAGNPARNKGDEASIDVNPEHFKASFKDGDNGTVSLILDETTCIEIFAGFHPPKRYAWIPINHEGKKAEPDDIDTDGDDSTANKFESVGGVYHPECEAISFHSPVISGDCMYLPVGVITVGFPSPYRTVRECEDAIEKGEFVEWVLRESYFGEEIEDVYYGKVVTGGDGGQNPRPGYTLPRYRFTKGECGGEEGPFDGDNTFRPKTVRDPNYKIPQDCYRGNPEAKIGYNKVENGLENVWVPRTATIPIKIEGYGKTNTANEIGGLVNEFDEPIQFHQHVATESGYYRATVTELRHAAISFDSWTSYLRAFAPHLPCYMFSQNAFFSNAWAGLCPVIHRDVSVGVGTASVDALSSIASALSRGQSNMTFTKAQNHQVSSKERAEKLTGRGPQKGELTDYEDSKLQLDMAYKAVRDVATNFYGRKFLVPLPIVPPKKVFCSGYKPKTSDAGPAFRVKGLRYNNKKECEANGFEWKAHPDLSKMLDSSGVEDINNWEIVSSAWPGGTVNLKTDGADSYPTNLNFWNDDGNLKAFALFPSKIRNRINEQQQNVGFNNYDPEKLHNTDGQGVGILAGLLSAGDVGLTEMADSFGDKVYVEIEVDPKIYWLHERSFMERVLGQQYFMHETGETEANPVGGEREFHKYAEVGTRTNPIELNDRSLFKTHDVNEADDVGGDDAFANILDFGESGPKRPYALITLPEKVIYQENDKIGSEKLNSDDRAVPNFPLGFEVPLSETKNSEDLFKTWTFQQGSETAAALKHVVQNLNRQTLDSFNGIDVDRASMIAAAIKPWHAGIPQESNLYAWGPFISGAGYGRVEADFDSSYHPAVFGGEAYLEEAAYYHVKAKRERNVDKSFEAGSITLASGPEHALGAQPILLFPERLPDHLGGGEVKKFFDRNVLAPYVTDIAVDVGTNGISTRYSFNSQARFGDLDSIYEQRLRKAQKDLIRNLKKQEADQRRTRRNISEFKQ